MATEAPIFVELCKEGAAAALLAKFPSLNPQMRLVRPAILIRLGGSMIRPAVRDDLISVHDSHSAFRSTLVMQAALNLFPLHPHDFMVCAIQNNENLHFIYTAILAATWLPAPGQTAGAEKCTSQLRISTGRAFGFSLWPERSAHYPPRGASPRVGKIARRCRTRAQALGRIGMC